MNILYTCDNNYVWLMGISAISLFENNTSEVHMDVYLLGENITIENKKLLQDIAEEYGRNIIVVDVPKLDIPAALISVRWPLSAFTRLYCAQLLPEHLNTVLYLDCDTIINSNISNLKQIDISTKAFWGVKDCIGRLYKKNIGLDGNSAYINAGVLLINLDRLRNIDLGTRMSSYMQKYEHIIYYADQDVLNGAFADEIGTIPPQYDVMTIAAVYSYEEIKALRHPTGYYSNDEFSQAVHAPIIIHYTSNMRTIRPWFSNSDHPFKSKFRKYMAISPWKDRILNQMTFQTKEAKTIGVVEKLPRKIALTLLGLLHALIKPLYVRIKARL